MDSSFEGEHDKNIHYAAARGCIDCVKSILETYSNIRWVKNIIGSVTQLPTITAEKWEKDWRELLRLCCMLKINERKVWSNHGNHHNSDSLIKNSLKSVVLFTYRKLAPLSRRELLCRSEWWWWGEFLEIIFQLSIKETRRFFLFFFLLFFLSFASRHWFFFFSTFHAFLVVAIFSIFYVESAQRVLARCCYC